MARVLPYQVWESDGVVIPLSHHVGLKCCSFHMVNFLSSVNNSNLSCKEQIVDCDLILWDPHMVPSYLSKSLFSLDNPSFCALIYAPMHDGNIQTPYNWAVIFKGGPSSFF